MKVLLDECVPQPLRKLLLGHDVFTVGYLGWKGTRNGALLRRAADEGFDVLVTIDEGYATEQNVKALPTGVVLIDTGSDDVEVLERAIPLILSAFDGWVAKSFVRIVL